MCICTHTKVQWNFSFDRKWRDMNCWGDRALEMSWVPPNSAEGSESPWLPISGLAQRSIFFFPPSHRKQNLKSVPVGVIPKQALDELTGTAASDRGYTWANCPSAAPCSAEQAALPQVIVNLPALGCPKYCFIVIFRRYPDKSTESQKTINLNLSELYCIISCGMCITAAFLITQQVSFCGITVSFTEHTLCQA